MDLTEFIGFLSQPEDFSCTKFKEKTLRGLFRREGIGVIRMRRIKKIMNATEVAEYLGLHRETVYLYAKRGEIPAFKIGYNWRFNKKSIDKWLEEKEKHNLENKNKPNK